MNINLTHSASVIVQMPNPNGGPSLRVIAVPEPGSADEDPRRRWTVLFYVEGRAPSGTIDVIVDAAGNVAVEQTTPLLVFRRSPGEPSQAENDLHQHMLSGLAAAFLKLAEVKSPRQHG